MCHVSCHCSGIKTGFGVIGYNSERQYNVENGFLEAKHKQLVVTFVSDEGNQEASWFWAGIYSYICNIFFSVLVKIMKSELRCSVSKLALFTKQLNVFSFLSGIKLDQYETRSSQTSTKNNFEHLKLSGWNKVGFLPCWIFVSILNFCSV